MVIASSNHAAKSVAFACDHNSVRSPMAEGIMKWLHGNHMFVQSVGVHGGASIDGFVVEVMAELGIDLSNHQPRSFEELEVYGEDFTAYDMIISFTPAAHRRAIEYTRTTSLETVYWPTADPTIVEGTREQRLEAYREVREFIRGRIVELFG